ncbi:MAG: hypothetical protein ABIY50_06600 [Ignavibacteria bacterium]
MKNYILRLKIIPWLILALVLISFAFHEDNSIDKVFKNNTDTRILRTDDFGNILDGDKSDWDYNTKRYEYFIRNHNMFERPFVWNEPHVAEMPTPIYNSVDVNKVTVWWDPVGTENIKEFFVERNNLLDNLWIKRGKVITNGETGNKDLFTFVDVNLPEGIYMYRLRYSDRGHENYALMPGKAFVKSFDKFQFYPAFPNPVTDSVSFSFYLPEKQTVNMYFVNGNDTLYLLKDFPQIQGYYKLTTTKSALGFNNEIKRLYLDCESCDKKKNFGDVQFN